MGFDKNSSLFSFFIGAITSLNLNLKEHNQITVKVFLVLFILKLFEFLMWYDNKCKYGINESANIMGALLDNLIPSLIYILFTIKNGNLEKNAITFINAFYIFYVFYNYLTFLSNDKLCTLVNEHQTIIYGWNDNFNFALYLIVLSINIFKFYSAPDSYLIFVAIFAILLINKMKKGSEYKILNLLSSFIPLIMNKTQNLI